MNLLKKILFFSLLITCNVVIYSAEQQTPTFNLKDIIKSERLAEVTEELKLYDAIIENEQKFIDKINDKEGKKYISILSMVQSFENQQPQPSPASIIRLKLNIVNTAKKATFNYRYYDDRCYSKLTSTDRFLNISNHDIADLPDLLLNYSTTPEFAYFFQQNLLFPDQSPKPSPESIGMEKGIFDAMPKLLENFIPTVNPEYIGLLNCSINPFAVKKIRKDITLMVSAYTNKALCEIVKGMNKFSQGMEEATQRMASSTPKTQLPETPTKQPQVMTPSIKQAAAASIVQAQQPEQKSSIVSYLQRNIIASILSFAAAAGGIYLLKDWIQDLWNSLPSITPVEQ